MVLRFIRSKLILLLILPTPTCGKDVRPFFKHVEFYYRFVRNFSEIAKPLSSLIAKEVPLCLSEDYLEVFAKQKEALTTTSILHSPI